MVDSASLRVLLHCRTEYFHEVDTLLSTSEFGELPDILGIGIGAEGFH